MVSAAFPNRPFIFRENVWFKSNEVANNRSLVGWELWIHKTGYSPTYSDGLAARWLKLDGAFVYEYYGNGFDFRNGNDFLIATGESWIPHNSDGTKRLTIEADADFAVLGAIPGTLQSAIDLPRIPRASVPTFVNPPFDQLVAGGWAEINTNRADSSFTHDLDWAWGNRSGRALTNVGSGGNWLVPMDFLNEIPDATSGVGTMYTYTYTAGYGQRIGVVNQNFRVHAPASVVPTFTAVTHSEAVSEVSSQVGKYVQGISQLNLAITGAAGVYGSSIRSHKIEILKGTTVLQTINAASGKSATLTESGTLTIRGTVTDSRGRSATKSVSIDVLPYSPPALNAVNVERALSTGVVDIDEGTYLKVSINASVSSLVNSTERNALGYRISTRPYRTTTWTQKATRAPSGLSFNGSSLLTGPYEITSAYEVKIDVYDDLATSSVIMNVPVAAVFMHWDGSEGVGIGKFHEQGKLDVGGDIYQNGNLVVDKKTPGFGLRIGYAESIAGDQSGITTGLTEVTGTSVSITLAEEMDIEFYGVLTTYSGSAADVVQIRFRDDATNLQEFTSPANSSPTTSSTSCTQSVFGRVRLGAGAHRLNLAITRVVGSGSITITKASVRPSSLAIYAVS